MRAKGAEGGDGPQAGVHLPAPYRWHRTTTTRYHGSRIRGQYGKNHECILIHITVVKWDIKSYNTRTIFELYCVFIRHYFDKM